MNYRLIFLSLIIMITSCEYRQNIDYPLSKKVQVTDNYFGTEIEDPYRWLEDDNSEETGDWVKAQNEITFAYLNQLPGRDEINSRLTELWNFPKMTPPSREGGKYFFFKNDGLQNQSVLYSIDNPGAQPVVALDPNLLSGDGTVALSGLEISPCGKYLFYMIARSGSDWNEIFIKDLETGELLPDHIQWIKFSGISLLDNGFFYSAYDAPGEDEKLRKSNENQKVKYHRLGDDPAKDEVFFEEPQFPRRMFDLKLTEDKRFMILNKMEGSTGNASFVKDLSKKGNDFIPLMESFDYEFHVLENTDNFLYVLTNYKAPKYQIFRIDMNHPEEKFWVPVIPEKENVLETASFTGGKIIVRYMKDASSRLEVYNYDGTPDHKIELPGIGTAGNMSGKKDDMTGFFSFTSFNTPGEIYQYDFQSRQLSVYFRPEVKFNPDDYIVKQVFFESKDKTRIPIFLFHRKDIELNGKNPVLLYGYGGFNISYTPSFSAPRLFFVEKGGVFAMANLRGGGEYGEEWHQSGTKLQKQNVFDDFISAAEYLISEKYTSPERLAVQGGSNGGLLIGAVINQRPDLFRVALPQVGVMDMLRYHKFTIGWAWAGDYGTSEESNEMFEYLRKYSPYHNIRQDGNYPAVLATTADHDDRVVPAHTFKYIARLQEYNREGKHPLLVRIETKAGHGAGKPTSKAIEEWTDLLTFTFYHLGIKK